MAKTEDQPGGKGKNTGKKRADTGRKGPTKAAASQSRTTGTKRAGGARSTAAPIKHQEMLEAHVRFEVDRWSGERLADTVAEEVDALFEWLDTVALADLLPPVDTAKALADLLAEVEVTDEVVGLVADLVLAGRAALVDSDLTVGELANAEDIHAVIDQLSGMDDLRRQMLDVVTENPAYHRLIAHVLYHGVKAFALNENPVARHLPGAQSLIRLGQQGLNTAAPGLEEAVDRQIERFVQAQIGSTLNDTRRFLDQSLHGTNASDMVDALLTEFGPSRIGDLAAAIGTEDLEALVVLSAPLVTHLLTSGIAGRVAEPVLERVLTDYGGAPVAALLADFGVERDLVARHLAVIVAPAAAQAVASGWLEARARARLRPFYDSYGE